LLLVELTFCLLSSLWAGKEEYVFDLDRPENNANSIFAVRGKDVVVDDISVMDTITIYKPIFDPRDRAKVEVSLLSDGSGIEMKEPTVPTFFFTQVEDMYELDSDEERCASTILAHSVAATAIKNQVHRQSKRVVIEFPDGITCNKDFFNEAGDGLKLKKRFRMLEVELCKDAAGNPVTTHLTFMYWKVAVDGEEKKLGPDKNKPDDDDDLKNALHRMSKMNMNTGP